MVDNMMKLGTVEELGKLIRQRRKSLNLRIDDAAMMMGISKDTLSKIENGSDGVSIGKVYVVLKELGLKLFMEGTE